MLPFDPDAHAAAAATAAVTSYATPLAAVRAWFAVFFPGLKQPADDAEAATQAWRLALADHLKHHQLFVNLLRLMKGGVVAYEPVWAIGTGRTPTLDQIAEVHGFIRTRLAATTKAEAAGTRLLYGGSVKPSNAADIFALPNVDGALVGGASLKAADFAPIVAALSAA